MLSSLSELVVPISLVGLKPVIKSMPSTIGIAAKRVVRKFGVDLPKGVREQIYEATGSALNSIVEGRLTSIFGADFSHWDNLFFKAVGLSEFTKFSKLAAVNAFITHTQDLMKASLSEKQMAQWLREGGFNAAKSRNLTNFLNYYGIELPAGQDWVKNGMKADHPFAKQMVTGALRFSEDAVLTPNPATLPLWFSNPRLSWLKHLRTFNSLMFTRTMNRWKQELVSAHGNAYDFAINAPKIMTGVVGILAVSHMVNQIQDYLRYGEQGPPYQRSGWSTISRDIDRAGFAAGPLSDLWNAMTRAKLGIGDVISPEFSLLMHGSINMQRLS